jgi:SAM-dependent methyltransferase
MARTIAEQHFIDDLRGLAAGKLTSTMLQLVMELDVFKKLQGRSLSLQELGQELGMPAPSTRFLAQFLCREGYTYIRDGMLSNAPATEKFLIGNTDDVKTVRTIFNLDIPLDALKQRLYNPPILHWYQMRDEGGISDTSGLIKEQPGWHSALMTSNHGGRLTQGEEVALLYDFSRHHLLLDVGGATGGFCTAIRKSNPHLRCIVFDLPEVREVAEKYLADAGDSEHVSFVEGNFFNELPKGADVALVSQIIHHWTQEDGVLILRRVHEALEPGGTLVVKEIFMNDDWTGPVGGVFEAFILLGQEGKSGWQPTYGDMEGLIKEAGFLDLQRRPGLIIARKAA